MSRKNVTKMREIKLVTIVGARPQFIKAAPVSRAIKKHNGSHGVQVREVLVHSGQHYDYLMSKVFFDELGIPEPRYNIGAGSGAHGRQTGVMLEKIEDVLIKEKPDLVFVYGDTNTTLAGALAAVKLHIPIAHVEAGLRSYNKLMPEEINRVLTDHVSTLLFCPTRASVENLKKEGLSAGVYRVGDVMYDSFRFNIKIAERDSNILKTMGLTPKGYYLSTVHRAENTDNAGRLESILRAMNSCGKPVVLPLHPRTKKILDERSSRLRLKNIFMTEPLPYFDMAVLTKNASAVLTDSGGLQKEAYFLKVPCITLRDETEWMETCEAGWNVLTGADKLKIVDACLNLSFRKYSRHPAVYGNGNAAEKIVKLLIKHVA